MKRQKLEQNEGAKAGAFSYFVRLTQPGIRGSLTAVFRQRSE
jgi:hypothetical protein